MNKSDEKNSLISVIGERLVNGILKENPTFVLLLGMCPTLAVTTSAINGFGMGATTLVVLALSNMMISALRKVIPDKIRIPAFIVIIASFVTIVELLLNAYISSLYDALGLYIPLIVVNCIILGRAEAYAYSNPVIPSLFDGIGMGAGFTIALTIIGAFRELLGNGSVFGARIMPSGFVPVSIFVMAPGAFFVLAMLTAIQNAVKIAGTKRGKDMSKIQSGCGGNCLECNKDCKVELISETTDSEEAIDSTTILSDSASDSSETKIESSLEVFADSQESLSVLKETVSESESIASLSLESDSAEVLESDSLSESIFSESDTVTDAGSESAAVISESSESILTLEEIKSESLDATDIEDNTKEAVSVSESEAETINVKIQSEDEEIELLDLTEMKKPAKSNGKATKKPVRKKSSMARAKEMLSKADGTVKEEKHD